MAVSMRTGHDTALLRLAPAEQSEETVLQASQHLQLLALRRVLAEEAAPVGGTVARALVKRSLDIVVSALLLLLALPVIVAVAVAIKLDSRGPVFYAARRIGHGGRPLRMYKFRKMRHRAAGPKLTTDGDHRFTRVGEWLAKSKLDELPQLWNVLRRDMSPIRPRPQHPSLVSPPAAVFLQSLRLRPGLTRASQVTL